MHQELSTIRCLNKHVYASLPLMIHNSWNDSTFHLKILKPISGDTNVSSLLHRPSRPYGCTSPAVIAHQSQAQLQQEPGNTSSCHINLRLFFLMDSKLHWDCAGGLRSVPRLSLMTSLDLVQLTCSRQDPRNNPVEGENPWAEIPAQALGNTVNQYCEAYICQTCKALRTIDLKMPTAVQTLIVTPKASAIFLDISPLQKTALQLLQFDILSKGLQNLVRTFHSHNKHFLNISPFPKLISLNLMLKATFYPSILTINKQK